MMPGSWGTDMIAPTTGELRHEIKLLVEHGELARIKMWLRLHPANFSPTYPQRRVNNIYFDTENLANVEANLAGISERRKLRLRWYGETRYVEHGTWEIKCKQAGLGWKITQQVSEAFSLCEISWPHVLRHLKASAIGTIGIHLADSLRPTIINHYERLYYVSWDGSIRATVDYQQAFYDQRLSASPNLTRPLPSPNDVILEFKTRPEFYDRLVAIVQRIPVRVARNSKYVNGMLYAASL